MYYLVWVRHKQEDDELSFSSYPFSYGPCSDITALATIVSDEAWSGCDDSRNIINELSAYCKGDTPGCSVTSKEAYRECAIAALKNVESTIELHKFFNHMDGDITQALIKTDHPMTTEELVALVNAAD